ncbi:hypothetical protein OKN36_12210 [Furfurilactobacillus sp. OKN36]
MGISQSNIYIYFKNKDDLIKQTFLSAKQLMIDYLLAYFDASAGPLVNIEMFLRSLYQFATDQPVATSLIVQIEYSPILSTLEMDHEETFLDFKYIEDEVKKGIASGELRPMSPNVLLGMGLSTIVSYAQAIRMNQADPVRSPLSGVIEMIMAGLKRP